MLYVLSIIVLIIEVIAFVLLIIRVFKFHHLSIKDTFAYPLIILIVTVVILAIEQKDGTNFWENLVNGLSHSIDIVKLTVDKSYSVNFENFTLDRQFLIVNYYISYLISATALFSLSVSLVKASLKNFMNWLIYKKQHEKTYVFGFNEDAKNFIMGLVSEKKKNVLVVLDSSKLEKYVEERLFLEKYKIAYCKHPYSSEKEMYNTIAKICMGKFKNTIVNIITFFNNDSQNLSFVKAAKKCLSDNDCYGGFYFDKYDKKFRKGDIICVKFKGKFKEKNNVIKINEEECIAKNVRKNLFAFDTAKIPFKDGKYTIEFAYDNDNKNKSLYCVDLKSFNNKIGKNNFLEFVYNDGYSKEDFEISKIKFKKQSNIFLNINCDGVQQNIIESIITNEESEKYGDYYYDEITNKSINKGSIICIKFFEHKKFEERVINAKLGNLDPISYNVEDGYFIFNTSSLEFNKLENGIKLKISYGNKDAINREKNDINLLKIKTKINEKKDVKILLNMEDSINVRFKVYSLNRFKRDYVSGNLQESKPKDSSHGLIRTYNKYEMISIDFVKQYSFAKFIEGKNINDDCTLENCDINLYVLGYGKINQVLLRDTLICNSFAKRIYFDEKSKDKYSLDSKRINVKVFDKGKNIEDYNYSNGFTKYNKKDFSIYDHLELPDNYINYPDDFEFDCQISNYEFVKKIYKDVKDKCDKTNKMQYNFFMISVDSDAKNWDIANVLYDSLNNVFNNSKNIFFVRTKSYEFINSNKKYFESRNMFSYGIEFADNFVKINYFKYFLKSFFNKNKKQNNNLLSSSEKNSDLDNNRIMKEKSNEKHTVFSYSNIIDDCLVYDAKEKHLEYETNHETKFDKEIVKLSYTMLDRFKQKSNIYSILGSYSKLNLIKKVSNNSIYKLDDLLDDKCDKNGNKIQHAYNELVGYNKYSISQVMAFIEHERWNAFELGFGVLPMKISDVFDLNNKLYNDAKNKKPGSEKKQEFKNQNEFKYHLCITTMKGLADLYDIFSNNKYIINDGNKIKELEFANCVGYKYLEEFDINDLNYLKYDYKIMDYFKTHPIKISDFLEVEE